MSARRKKVRKGAPPPLGFEWSQRKAHYNEWKHAVSFIEAATVFGDPNSIDVFDDVHSIDEDRFLLIGMSARQRLLVVLHTEGRADNIRIIGARDVEPTERRRYEEGEADAG